MDWNAIREQERIEEERQHHYERPVDGNHHREHPYHHHHRGGEYAHRGQQQHRHSRFDRGDNGRNHQFNGWNRAQRDQMFDVQDPRQFDHFGAPAQWPVAEYEQFPVHDRPRQERYHRKRQEHAGAHRPSDVGALPSKWKNYIAVGAEVSGTPFIPFKTPLRPEFNGRLRKTEIFNVETLMHCARNSDKRIGFVIDLTNTTRYYDANLWKNYGIRYHKIPNSGRDVHTQGEFFDRFKKAVDEFRKENEESGDDLLIGVHCTHGLNRTGYLICRYMIEVLNIDAKGAISEFEKSRGHAIRRSEYINALKEIAQMKPDFNEEEWAEGMSEKSRKAAVETSRKRSWLDALHEEEAKDPAPTEVTPENSNPQE